MVAKTARIISVSIGFGSLECGIDVDEETKKRWLEVLKFHDEHNTTCEAQVIGANTFTEVG